MEQQNNKSKTERRGASTLMRGLAPREIKFRGKVDGRFWTATPESDSWEQFWAVTDSDTITQFTGLKDKNGKEIYKGDIVRTKWGGVGYIEFTDGGFHFIFENGHVKRLVNRYEAEDREIEIIGNIFDNSELIP